MIKDKTREKVDGDGKDVVFEKSSSRYLFGAYSESICWFLSCCGRGT